MQQSKAGKGGSRYERVKRGEFTFGKMDPCEMENVLEYLTAFKGVQKKVKGRKDVFYSMLGWAYLQPGVDKVRLRECVLARYMELPEAGNVETFLIGLENIYNRGLAKNKRIGFRQVWLDSSKMMLA